MNEQHLAKIRREIMRLAKSENEASELISALSMTDWSAIYVDTVSCDTCGRAVQPRDIVNITEEGISKKLCKPCSPTSKKCITCDAIFLGYRHNGLWCPKCRTFPCAICLKSITIKYPAYLKVCASCMTSHGINWEVTSREGQKLSVHLSRTNEKDVAGALTIEQWLKTLVDHNWACAYCLSQPYNHMDHFIPVCKGGKTVVANCVPSCKKCNASKHQLHPNDVTGIPQEAMVRVLGYLQSR